jgi:hypothetical protein
MNTGKKILEVILLLAAIATSAFATLFYTIMIIETARNDMDTHTLRSIGLLAGWMGGIIGFFSLIARIIAILVGSHSRIIRAGLIIGLCAYAVYMAALLYNFKSGDVQLLLVYTIPLIAYGYSVWRMGVEGRNI